MTKSGDSYTADPTNRISVIIPCFNDGATVQEAVQSVLAQAANCELLVVNDGSSDPATLAVFEDLAKANIRIIHQENQGLPSARMAGVAHSNGEYILPLDADDKLLPNALSLLGTALDSSPDAAFAYGNCQVFGRYTFLHTMPKQLDPWLITYYNTMPVVALFRRTVIDAIGGWQHDLGYEDWDMWMTLAERQYTGVYINRSVFAYRIRAGSLLSEARTRHYDIYTSLQRRHQLLFACQRQNLQASPQKWWTKAGALIIQQLPIDSFTRSLWISRLAQFNTSQGWLRLVRERFAVLPKGS
jgi:glycosyltransferase involved in cell wall biosynthesis